MQRSGIPALPPGRLPALPPGRGHSTGIGRSRTGERLRFMVSVMSRARFFQRCSLDQLEYLAATASPMIFEPGDALCIEGTYAPACYVVAEGRAAVTVGRHGVGAAGPDDVVGERGIVLDTVRAATVTARMHMETFAIPRETLQTLIEDCRPVRRWMLEDVLMHYSRAR